MDNNTARSKRPLWQWIAIIILIAGAVYAAIYFLWLNPQSKNSPNDNINSQATKTSPTTTPSPTQSNHIPQTYTITETKDGFTPANIVVYPGDTITWQNKTGKNIQIASDPHPKDNDYLPLNLGVTANNQSVSLTIRDQGMHGYHDHLNPSRQGTIVVQ